MMRYDYDPVGWDQQLGHPLRDEQLCPKMKGKASWVPVKLPPIRRSAVVQP